MPAFRYIYYITLPTCEWHDFGFTSLLAFRCQGKYPCLKEQFQATSCAVRLGLESLSTGLQNDSTGKVSRIYIRRTFSTYFPYIYQRGRSYSIIVSVSDPLITSELMAGYRENWYPCVTEGLINFALFIDL
jgi:hypothetical protein